MKAKLYMLVTVVLLGVSLDNLCYAEEAAPPEPISRKPKVSSFHAGIFHPNGVDLVGYSVERETAEGLHWFYTLGFPSFAAGGLSYYENYRDNGMFATVGIGIGSAAYASLGYQWRLSGKQYLKTGLGFTGGVAYSGLIPVLSYEHRYE